MLIDIHVHSAISPCSILPLQDIPGLARDAGLDCVCVTDHDTMAAASFIREGMQDDGLILLVGMEYSTPDGQFLIFGPFDDLETGMDAEELLGLVDRRGGAAVAAHPFRSFRPVAGRLLELCHDIETMNGGNRHSENLRACEAAERLGVTGIGASDAHSAHDVGRVASRCPVDIKSREDLIRAIRNGQLRSTSPCP